MGHEEDLSKAICESGSVAPRRCPTPGYVLRTDILKRGTRAFINVCKSEEIGKPCCRNDNGHRDGLWSVPYGLACPYDDLAKRGDRCRVYDFIVHPTTFRMAEVSTSFKKAINDLAIESTGKQFNVRLDKKNPTFLEITYKGVLTPVSFTENSAKITLDRTDNELHEYFMNLNFEEKLNLHGEKWRSNPVVVDTGSMKLENGTDNEDGKGSNCLPNEPSAVSGKNDGPEACVKGKIATEVLRKSTDDILSSELSREQVTETSVGGKVISVLPDYESQQDETTVTFIFAVGNVKNDDLFFTVKSPQEVTLKMSTKEESGSISCYVCCLKFGNKCRLMENGCHVDISAVNVVLTLAKAEKSHGIWNTYFIGTSFKHLDVRDFTTLDNLKKELDLLDRNGVSTVAGKTESAVVADDKELMPVTKAEEKEMDDIPGEIVVVHEKGLPRLHSILKQRSMSESSDDVSLWSCYTDRRLSTTTGSDTESDEEDNRSSPGPFRPGIKKSVSFSEHFDQTMFVTNQSVSQMHTALKNKRRRIRKRELKQEQKEGKRRFRSNSDSCSHEERDFDSSKESLVSGLAMNDFQGKKGNFRSFSLEVDGTVFKDDGNIILPSDDDITNGMDNNKRQEGEKFDAGESYSIGVLDDSGVTKNDLDIETQELEKFHKSLQGTTWISLSDKTNLETCCGTSNGEVNNLYGSRLVMGFRDSEHSSSHKLNVCTPAERALIVVPPVPERFDDSLPSEWTLLKPVDGEVSVEKFPPDENAASNADLSRQFALKLHNATDPAHPDAKPTSDGKLLDSDIMQYKAAEGSAVDRVGMASVSL